MRRLLLICYHQGAVGLALQPAGRVAAGQRDDLAALQFTQPPGPARAGQIAEIIQAAGVEAVQPAVDGAGMAVQRLGDLADLGAVPAHGDDAGALQPACWRMPGAGEPAHAALLGGVGGWLGEQRRQHGSLPCHKVRNTLREPSSYN
jgi:hypothetical protein